jgi:hypothetical protein
MKEVSIELEGPTKSQNGTEIDQHPLLFGDEVSFAFTLSFGDPTQDSTFTWRWSLSQSRHQHST